MFIVRWRGEPPPDKADWINALRDVMAGSSGSYHIDFYEGEAGWRFDFECREDLGANDEEVLANSPETLRFNVYQTLVERGKPMDPAWRSAPVSAPPQDSSEAEVSRPVAEARLPARKGPDQADLKARRLPAEAAGAATGSDRGAVVLLDPGSVVFAPIRQAPASRPAMDRDRGGPRPVETEARPLEVAARPAVVEAIPAKDARPPGVEARPRRKRPGKSPTSSPGDVGVPGLASESRTQPAQHERGQQRRPAETVVFGPPVAPELPVPLSPEAPTLDASTTAVILEEPATEPARAARPMALATGALAVLAAGGLLAVLLYAVPLRQLVREAPPPATLQPMPSSTPDSQAVRPSAEASRLLEMRKVAEAAMARVRKLEEKLTLLQAEKPSVEVRSAPGTQGEGQAVDPAAVARALEEEEQSKLRAAQESAQQEAARARAAAPAPTATLPSPPATLPAPPATLQGPPATLAPTPPPQPAVKPGQLVDLTDQGVIAPISEYKPALAYPRLALSRKVEGAVELNVLVDENGDVVDTRVVTAAGGRAGLQEAAVDYAKRWKFRPATKDGVPVQVWLPVRIDFRLPR